MHPQPISSGHDTRRRHVATPMLLLAVLLSGCAAAPLPPAPSHTPSPAPPESRAPAPAREAVRADPVQPSPTLALRQDSARAAASGQFDRAIALLERAIRIEPADPSLWLELARVHFDRGDHEEAEQFARKALSLSGNRHHLEQQAWLIIDQVQQANRP